MSHWRVEDWSSMLSSLGSCSWGGLRCFRARCWGALLVALVIGSAAASAQSSGRQTAAAPPGRAGGQTPGQAPGGQAPSGAAPQLGIAAVVNDEVISIFDLISRVRLVMLSSNIADTPETRQRIAPQVLRSLIDEKLQLQEAKRQSVTASDEELNKGLDQIEKQNNMRSGQLNEFMKSRGLDRGQLVDQLTASIVWAKLVK